MERNFPPSNDMENVQWDNRILSQIRQQSGQVIDLMDYDSHTQNYAKTSLDAEFSAVIFTLATSYPDLYEMHCFSNSPSSRAIYSMQFKET